MVIAICALPSKADINYADNAGFSITNVSESNAPINDVYTQFIEQVDMWWPKDHTWWKGKLHIDEKAGGCFCETTDTASAANMQVSVIENPHTKKRDSASQDVGNVHKRTKVTLTYNAIGTIHFNGTKATNDEAVNLVTIVDSVQAQQLNALTDYSDTLFRPQ